MTINRPADHWRSVLTENRAADVDYRWSVNPYQGCATACTYCDAHEGHADFATKIVARHDAAALLRAAFERPTWEGDTVTFSGLTDAYQTLEAELRLTRACLEVCLWFRNPVRIVTKMTLVERDLDLLVALAKEARLHIDVSLAFGDEALARALEPGAPSVAERLRLIQRLAAVGVSVGVMAAPIIPGLSDAQLVPLLERAAAAGARTATWTQLRLAATKQPIVAVPPGDPLSYDALDALLRATCDRLGLAARPFAKQRELATTFSRTDRQLSLL